MQAEVLEKSSKAELTDLYRQMYLIREFERRSGEMYTRGRIRGFLHLYSGQEAIAVGAISVLEDHDYIVTHYRDHGHALARGIDPNGIMAELFGKKTGTSGGKGGSMHLFDASKRFMGGHAIVGGHLPMAAVLALACQYQKSDAVVLLFLGDGAINQGEFHETMNLAAVWDLPLLFFLENNHYGMGSSVERVHARGGDFSSAGAPYDIDCVVVDGMDLLAVREATETAIRKLRDGSGPAFIEAKTFRFHGHSMADPVKYRSDEEEDYWRKQDPLLRFSETLIQRGLTSEDELKGVRTDVEALIGDAVKFAEESPDPDPDEDLMNGIYA